jgi:hypothetical protein
MCLIARAKHTVFLALSLILVVILSIRPASALPQDAGEIAADQDRRIQRAASDSMGVAGASPLTSFHVEDSYETTIRGAAPPIVKREFKVPPMVGFQQMAGSKPVKDMLKKLITAEVPVMFQTMMMVENGAATGYIGSMNTVGGLLSNTIQASQLQMDMYDALDTSGEKKREMIASAYKSMTEDPQNKNIWPAALIYSLGDKLGATSTPAPQWTAFSENPTGYGSGPKDLDPRNASSGGNSGKSLAAKATNAGASQSGSPVLLSQRLFDSNGAYVTAQQQVQNKDTKDALLKWVGDIEISANVAEGGVSRGDLLFSSETKVTPKDATTQAGADEPQGNIYKLLMHRTNLELWKHMNTVMKVYCEHKKSEDNYEKDLFKKERPSQALERNAKDAWGKIHSFDIRISINLVDQLFKLFVGRTPIKEVKCESFQGNVESMPSLNQSEFDSEPTGGDGTFDSCEGANGKTCLRNIIMFKVVQFISISQVNHYYRSIWLSSNMRTQEESDRKLLDYLFCSQLKFAGEQSEWPCDPSHELSLRVEQNSMSWVEFTNQLGKLAQGQGGSSIFRSGGASTNLNPLAVEQGGGSGR